MKMNIKKIVLAYSGGLDTSIIVPWLRENYGSEVVTFSGNVGQGEELNGVKEKAMASGASKAYVCDLTEEFLMEYAFPTMMAGAIYETRYLLGTATARPVIAKHLVQMAEEENAEAIAHGCTGKGNDQVRFELAVKALNPKLQIIAPWREWDIHSREDALSYAAEHGIPVAQSTESIYSRDRNIWHMSHEGGVLEDPWQEPPEKVYMLTENPSLAPDEPTYVTLDFEAGYPIGLNGNTMGPVELMTELNQLAGENGVGRADIVENRLVGMKSRGIYETPGGTVLYAAHQALESLCLDRETMHYKNLIAQRFAELVYYGRWFSPLREALWAFVKETQQTVTGSVRTRLLKGSCAISGCKSPFSLYREDLATFGQDEVYNQRDAEGFINLFGLPLKVRAMLGENSVPEAPAYKHFRD